MRRVDTLTPRHPDAVARRVRAQTDGAAHSWMISAPSGVGARGKVIFDGHWGPFDPVCFGDRFMIVVGSDSIETFSFDIGPSIQ